MGHTYLKALYREFTDDSFETPVPQRNPSDGMAGPTLHAEVGDMITIVFQVSTICNEAACVKRTMLLPEVARPTKWV